MNYFSKLNFTQGTYGLSRATICFPNKYGASVITGPGAYGNENKPYEIAILYNGHITYDTPITDDVLGYLNREEVEDILNKISELPERVRVA